MHTGFFRLAGRTTGRVAALLGACLAWIALAVDAARLPPANLARYGFLRLERREPAAGPTPEVARLADPANTAAVALEAGDAVLVEWQHPRPVRELELVFTAPPPAGAVQVEWWRGHWPDVGQGGWRKLDDPFNGRWTIGQGAFQPHGPGLAFRFAPLTVGEAPGIRQTGAPFRQTYKLRLTCNQAVRLRHVAVHSDAVLRRARLRFEWDLPQALPARVAPRFEARNGAVQSVITAGPKAAIVEVEYADAPDRLSPDRGLVIFRRGPERSFSVFVDDVLRAGGLWVRDLGVFVSDASRSLTFATWPGPGGDAWRQGTVAEQVARLPEQTFARAVAALPAKSPAPCLLGVPNCRQEFALEPNGDLVLHAGSLRSPGPDADACPWRRWDALRFEFSSGEHPPLNGRRARVVERSLQDGWLPVVRHAWADDGLAWEQISVAVPLLTPLAAFEPVTGAEPLVLATRFTVTNTTASTRTAWLWLDPQPRLPLGLGADGTLVLERPSDNVPRAGLAPVRGRFVTGGRGELDLGVLVPAAADAPAARPADAYEAREAVRYRVTLDPGEGHALDFFLPYVELLDAAEMRALRRLSFPHLRAAVVEFWRARVSRGMLLETPEPWLNDFFKAHLWHVLISTDLDPVTRHHQHGAATLDYKNYLNETAMVARALDMRGEHVAARALLEPFLVNQGAKGLPGNFRDRTGVFYAAHPGEPDPYTAQGYNLHHGWGLWAAAEHYLWTRDDAYLAAIAPRLIAGADWITRERRATQFKLPDGARPVEYGLPPAGDLEDVEEYLYWYAVAAYYHLGMKQAADAVARLARRPGVAPELARRLAREAERLGRDTEAFAEDVRASVAESVATSPVVQLRDGTWVPYVPARAYALTHGQEGWIREVLYGPLHLVNGGLLDDRHPFVDWIVQDLEDNLFLSAESGFGVADPQADFFNRGGFTLQPMLLDLPLVYLRRDQVPNFLRAFHNAAAASLYPDTRCLAEWLPELGRGGGPLYKTPDESKFIQWLRQMLILERGDTLELGLGVPRAWMADGQRVKVERAATWFGRLDLEITSRAAAGEIRAVVRLHPTEAPRAIGLRLRHPAGQPLKSATVNGRSASVNAARQLIELPARATVWEVVGRFD